MHKKEVRFLEHTIYLQTGSTDPAYNLAFEEYVLNNRTEGNILILWQNENAVIIGRNQNTAQEIDSAFVAEHGIRVVRRNTGGGAVYHDLGNLNYSFITDDSADRKGFTEPVVKALQALGLDTCASGRNDILVNGLKVSGTAQQITKGRILHHGTLLFDSDPSMIAGALTPDPNKFRSKGIKSVRSRVGNIRSQLRTDMTLQAFWQYLENSLADSLVCACLTAEEHQQILQLKAEKYDQWDWNYGKSPAYEMSSKAHFSGGSLEVKLSVKAGKITAIRLFGDFLAIRPVAILEDGLLGCPCREDALKEALTQLPVADCLGSITAEELLKLILESK
jgi:lipoate-protein ligase A